MFVLIIGFIADYCFVLMLRNYLNAMVCHSLLENKSASKYIFRRAGHHDRAAIA